MCSQGTPCAWRQLTHHPDVVFRVAPVPLRRHVSKLQHFLLTERDLCNGAGNLPGDKGLTPPRGLVVEENAVTQVHCVSGMVSEVRSECANVSIHEVACYRSNRTDERALLGCRGFRYGIRVRLPISILAIELTKNEMDGGPSMLSGVRFTVVDDDPVRV